MKPTIAIAVVATVSAAMIARPAASRADNHPSPSPAVAVAAAAAAENRDSLATTRPMSEDMRVKAEEIDSVMQDGKVRQAQARQNSTLVRIVPSIALSDFRAARLERSLASTSITT